MYGMVWRRFPPVPYCVTGRLAALAQGLPVRPLRLDLIVAEADVPAANAAMGRLNVGRWSERHQDYLGFGSDLDDVAELARRLDERADVADVIRTQAHPEGAPFAGL
jgi:hypothetical protein